MIGLTFYKKSKDSNYSWFDRCSLQRLFFQLSQAVNKHTAWMPVGIRAKYIQIRIDMRTGDFLIMDQAGEILTEQDLKKLFPDVTVSVLPEQGAPK
jgi:hypothetical protein